LLACFKPPAADWTCRLTVRLTLSHCCTERCCIYSPKFVCKS
jgi:hypothetical protein